MTVESDYTRPTREDLIAICERAFTPQEKWRNRDSGDAHRQLGECYALLKAGCDFYVRYDGRLHTWWVTVEYHGFDYFEYGAQEGCTSNEQFYLPTAERLDARPGEDWY